MLKTLLLVNLKGLFHSMFKGGSDKKKSKKKSGPAAIALISVFALFIVSALMFSIGMLFYSFGASFMQSGLNWLYFALSSIFIFLLTFIGSVFTTQNLIFNAKDNELLLSMPIPPFYILASRVLLLFVLNLMYGVLMAVPAIVVYFILNGFSAATLVLFIISTLLIVVFSSAITCFLGWLIALISSRFKKSNLLQTVISLVFFGVYFVVCFNMQSYMQTLVENGEIIANAIRKSMPPFYYFGLVCAEHSIWALAALAAISIIPFALACLLISKSFIKIAAGKKSASKTKYVEKELKVSSVKSALFKKELGRFFSLPIYILNSVTGCIMQILFTGMIVFEGKELMLRLSMLEDFALNEYVPIVVAMVMGLCSAMVNPAAASISLEGSRINILRTMPVNSDDFYFSKFMCNFIIGIPTLTIGTAVSCLILGVDVLTAAITLIALIVFFTLTTLINLTANMCLPRFSWNSEAVVIKQGGSIIIGMLAGFAATALAFAPFFSLAKYISVNIYLLCSALVCGFICLALAKFIKTSGRERFEQMCV